MTVDTLVDTLRTLHLQTSQTFIQQWTFVAGIYISDESGCGCSRR